MMQSDGLIEIMSKVAPLHPSDPGPATKLAKEVYVASPQMNKEVMLSLLVGSAYEACPLHVKKSLLEQLIRSVGVLGLVTVAGGVFAKFRLSESWPDVLVNTDDLPMIKNSDVAALVDYVHQVSLGALVDGAQLLASNPALTGSWAVGVLATLMLSRIPERRKILRILT